MLCMHFVWVGELEGRGFVLIWQVSLVWRWSLHYFEINWAECIRYEHHGPHGWFWALRHVRGDHDDMYHSSPKVFLLTSCTTIHMRQLWRYHTWENFCQLESNILTSYPLVDSMPQPIITAWLRTVLCTPVTPPCKVLLTVIWICVGPFWQK